MISRKPILLTNELGVRQSQNFFVSMGRKGLPSIDVDIEHPSNGNVPIAGRISDSLWAKIRWSLLTP